VDQQPDPVAEPVAECAAEAGFLDHTARSRVGLDAGEARPHGSERSELRLEADRVGLGEVRRRRAGGERPRAVGAVAVDDCAGVHHDQIAFGNQTIGWMGVRQRAVCAGAEPDVEREPFAAVLVQEDLETPCELPLAPAEEGLLPPAARTPWS
jgi:hypothetical protein